MRNRLLPLATLALLLTACGDVTGPPPTLVGVEVAELLGPMLGTDANGDPTYSCEFDLIAVAVGTGSATWLDATFRVFEEGSSTPTSVTQVGADVVRDVWGFDTILAGESQTSQWLATHGFPFTGRMEFRYSSDGRIGTSVVSFECMP